MCGGAKAQYNNQRDPGTPMSLDANVQPVTSVLRRVSAASARGGAVRWKKWSHAGFRLPTPSPGRLPECATPICERKGPAASVGAGLHIGAKKSWQSLRVHHSSVCRV